MKAKHPLVEVAGHLLACLAAPVTRTALTETLLSHPQFPSLLSLAESFEEWGVDALPVRLRAGQWEQVSTPLVAELQAENDQEHWSVVESLSEEAVTYTVFGEGAPYSITEPLEAFLTRTTGVALLAEADAQAGEGDYAAHRRQERLKQAAVPVVTVAAVFLLGLGLWRLQSSLLVGWSVVNLLGLAFCVALLAEKWGEAGSFVKKLCGTGPKLGCDRVVNSSAGTLFGWLSLAEVGLVYFAGTMLTLSLSPATAGWLLVLNALALPYTVFSVGYQAFVVKAWCRLCLGVQAVLWVSALLGYVIWQGLDLAFGREQLLLTAAGFVLATLGYMAVHAWQKERRRAQRLERENRRFKRSPEVFAALLEKQPVVDTQGLPDELVLGSSDAPVTLTVVSNPYCPPCTEAHPVLERLLNRFPGGVKLVLRFTGNPYDEADRHNQAARHLISLARQPNRAAAVHDWYATKDYAAWSARYPADPDVDAAHLHRLHLAWCERAGVEYTPSTFINGRLLPGIFTVRDLPFHLKGLLQREDLLVQ